MKGNPGITAAFYQSGLVPVFFHGDTAVASAVLDACYRAGVRVFEFTNRGANAAEVFTHLVKQAGRYPDLYIGIGTVLDAATTTRFIDMGAHFIVSPVLKEDMADVCEARGIPWIPGCATLTEIVRARDRGAEVIKLFPGSVLGPGFVSAVLPVIPGLKLMPTGGVEPTEANLGAWFRAGVHCVGMGSQLFSKTLIEERQWPTLEDQVRQAVQLIAKLRG